MAEEEKKQELQDQEDPLASLLEEDDEEASSEEEKSQEESEVVEETPEETKEEPEKEAPQAEDDKNEKEEQAEDAKNAAEDEDLLAALLEDEDESQRETQPEEKVSAEEEQKEEEQKESEEELEELQEAEESTEESKEPEKKNLLKTLVIYLVMLIPFVFAGAGGYFLWHLYKNPLIPGVETTPPKKVPPTANKSPHETPLVTSPIAVEDRKILLLKDFLIPYRRETGEFVFVKANVLLYFANSRDFERAKEVETLYREEIYRLFKNAPLYVWETKKGAQAIKKEIKRYLTSKKLGGVVPTDLEVTGYILK